MTASSSTGSFAFATSTPSTWRIASPCTADQATCATCCPLSPRAYPAAELWASPGLPERRRDLRFAGVLGDRPEPAWAPDLDQLTTDGNVFFSEVVFFHAASGTLIVADKYTHSIKVIAPDGRLVLTIGTGKPGRGPDVFTTPEGVETRGDTLWIADSGNNRIVKYRLKLK